MPRADPVVLRRPQGYRADPSPRRRSELRVLDRPQIPLHTTGSENDIRACVAKRRISSGTQSEAGCNRRDTCLGPAKTQPSPASASAVSGLPPAGSRRFAYARPAGTRQAAGHSLTAGGAPVTETRLVLDVVAVRNDRADTLAAGGVVGFGILALVDDDPARGHLRAEVEEHPELPAVAGLVAGEVDVERPTRGGRT